MELYYVICKDVHKTYHFHTWISYRMLSNEEILKAALPNNQENEIEEPPLDPVTCKDIITRRVILYLKQQENCFGMKKEELKFIKKHFISANFNSFINSK